MDYEAIISAVRAIVIALEGKLPAADIENAWGLIDGDEPGVALENLCTQLGEYDVPVPRAVLRQIAEAGNTMQLSADYWIDLAVEP